MCKWLKFDWLKLSWWKKKVLKSIIDNLIKQIKDFNLRKRVVDYVAQNEGHIIEQAEDAIAKVVKKIISKILEESKDKA